MAKARRKDKTTQMSPGYDGHVVVDTHVRITETRFDKRPTRCKAGSFEWSYGTRKSGTKLMLYHAGVHFAGLWEKAHISARSPSLIPTASTQWRGLPDSRAEAMTEIKRARLDLGRDTMSRLVDYCVLGSTVSEMAAKYDIDVRSMSAVLMADLQSAARHFRYE